jgi:hypothetical protein
MNGTIISATHAISCRWDDVSSGTIICTIPVVWDEEADSISGIIYNVM